MLLTQSSHHLTRLACRYPLSSLSVYHRSYRRSIRTEHQDTLPQGATVVICGGGIAGLSAAYHLAKLGLNDVVLLEQGRFVNLHKKKSILFWYLVIIEFAIKTHFSIALCT